MHAGSTQDVIQGATVRLEAALKSVLQNLDLKTIIAKLLQKALDLKTWIDLSEPDYVEEDNPTLGRRHKRKRTRLEKAVRVAFRVSDQYPDLMALAAWGLVAYMLGVALLLGVLQHWDMRV
jgi:hypothetical protein